MENQKEEGVVFFIRNKSGRFLLEQRDQNSKSHPWHFVFPGGGVESCGVDSVDTAIREAKEDFGILLQRENIKKIIALPRRNQKPGLSVVYFTEVDQSAPFVVSESGGMAWFTLEEIEKMEFRIRAKYQNTSSAKKFFTYPKVAFLHLTSLFFLNHVICRFA